MVIIMHEEVLAVVAQEEVAVLHQTFGLKKGELFIQEIDG